MAVIATAVFFPGSFARGASPSEPPNFVVIMADDLGYGTLSCYGGPIDTPHLDRLAEEGMKLTDFHSNGASCSPTRAALLTGRYQQRAGIPGVVNADPDMAVHDHGLQPQEITFAEVLSDAGYATGLVGKWHLGYHKRYNPLRQGFDRFVGFVSGNIGYQSHYDRMGVHDWWYGLKRVHEDGYTTHLITEHAVQFIEQREDRPFCLYVAHEAPHRPYQGPDDPPIREEGHVGVVWDDWKPSHAKPAYRKMVRALDRSVGRIVEALDERGLGENTLVMFFSDNGPTRFGHSGPLRGGKGSMFEGGHRVPGIARWPGRIEAGVTSDQPAATMDLMPTMLALAGAEAPAGHKLDGVDLSPMLLHRKPLGQRTLFWSVPTRGKGAVRHGKWKLVVGGGLKAPHLYNLAEDRSERNNLAGQMPQRTRKLRRKLAEWRRRMDRTATKQPGGGDAQ